MLKAELYKEIDKKWEGCWPVNNLRPLVLIDCICYLLFFKKVQENKLVAENTFDNDYVNDTEELSWNYIKDLDPKDLHNLLIKDNGTEHFLKNYAKIKS